MREHTVLAFNQVLQTVRKTGLSFETLQKVGKFLLRFFSVFQAYTTQKKKGTLNAWVYSISTLREEFSQAVA